MTRVEDIHTALNSRLNTAESVPLNTEGKDNVHRLILGKVLKMLGDDTALVQIGSTKIKAQLAAQLKADAFYWFQFEQEGGGSLNKLRPVQQFDQDPKTLKDAAAKLLEGFSLKNGLENMLTATAFLKEKPVINEGELKTAVKWIEQLQGADVKKGLQALLFALKKDLPIQQGVLQSILAVKSSSALHQDITALLNQLTQLPKHTDATQTLIQAVRSVVDAETAVHAEKLLSVLLAAREGVAKQDGNSPITTPLNPSQQKENSLAPIVQERQPSQVLQTNVQQSTSPKGLHIPLQQIERILASLMKQGADGQQEPNLKQLTALLQGLQQAGSQPDAKAAVLQKEFPFLSKREAKALAQVVQQTEPTLSNKTDVLDLLMTMKKAIGVRDEIGMLKLLEKGSQDVKSQELHQLKLTLNDVRQADLPEPIKKEVDQLFHRLNGQLFVQQENQTVSQMMVSYPLFSKHSVQDLTFILKGHKKKDGSIDISQCRLMFYLNMENLEETLIDCTIQQKVMSITVETAHELQGTINPMIPAVRENLNALGYSLTGITAKKRQEPVDPSQFLDEHFHKISEKGLDLRV
ncbi:glycosyltransferase [Bacillus safensis]|uniref:glycosyltransferase n=1 Tax=Bacillus safensis TaxID=561879 RepID=UPI0022390916|nr:glycosyltransferase [Bacillus safensis]MCW4642723.1 glycosyltransferase [Bacillus safensis]MCY7563030.1 glycosyltransferase [Bacillus safensis]MCY7623812.1 glycosyltransferase [Bacillus safensis]MCY7631931.1 glycosyltransferase [Bacillus safensis]MCY7647435.1 glycosyltransferase [Bacillus safensis]